MNLKHIIISLSVVMLAFGYSEAVDHCEIFAGSSFDYSSAQIISSSMESNISPMVCCSKCIATAGCNSFSYEMFPTNQVCTLYTLSDSTDRSSLQVNVSPNYIGFPW
jgi:hypothetical protein